MLLREGVRWRGFLPPFMSMQLDPDATRLQCAPNSFAQNGKRVAPQAIIRFGNSRAGISSKRQSRAVLRYAFSESHVTKEKQMPQATAIQISIINASTVLTDAEIRP